MSFFSLREQSITSAQIEAEADARIRESKPVPLKLELYISRSVSLNALQPCEWELCISGRSAVFGPAFGQVSPVVITIRSP